MVVVKKVQHQLPSYDRQIQSRRIARKKQLHSRQAKQKLAMLGLVMACALAALTLVAHFTLIVRTNYELDRANRELMSLLEEQQSLRLQIAALRSPQKLEQIALNELGLVYPDQSQFVVLAAGNSAVSGN